MTPEEFTKAFKTEKDSLLAIFTNPDSGSVAAMLAEEIKTQSGNGEKVNELIDTVLTDTFYTILLGLDGAASIGGIQRKFNIMDEDGNSVTEGGGIEEYAFEYFQN